jgi:hypothetical protein
VILSCIQLTGAGSLNVFLGTSGQITFLHLALLPFTQIPRFQDTLTSHPLQLTQGNIYYFASYVTYIKFMHRAATMLSGGEGVASLPIKTLKNGNVLGL